MHRIGLLYTVPLYRASPLDCFPPCMCASCVLKSTAGNTTRFCSFPYKNIGNILKPAACWGHLSKIAIYIAEGGESWLFTAFLGSFAHLFRFPAHGKCHVHRKNFQVMLTGYDHDSSPRLFHSDFYNSFTHSKEKDEKAQGNYNFNVYLCSSCFIWEKKLSILNIN